MDTWTINSSKNCSKKVNIFKQGKSVSKAAKFLEKKKRKRRSEIEIPSFQKKKKLWKDWNTEDGQVIKIL